MKRPALTFALALGAAAATAVRAHAQTTPAPPPPPSPPSGAEELPRIRITDPGRDLFRLALPRADGDGALARQATEIQSRDLDIVGLFRILDPTSFPPALLTEGLGYSSANWSLVGAQGVAKVKVTRDGLEGRLYQVGRGETAVLTKTYRLAADGDVRPAVHAWANDIIEHFTGQRGVFGSRIAFALGRSDREIATVDMDGSRMAVLTRMGSDCILPAYSPGGGEVAFTSFLRDNPDLWIVSAAGGRARRVSKQPGLNTGAAWAPGGGSLAITLSYEGSPDIYRVSAADGAIQGKLTSTPGIDSSPAFSPDGGQIAFVSNRQGSPQIWIMSAGGGTARRVTFQGKYNQTPKWNPRSDKPLIAFTGRDERGVFDIFTIDVRTGNVERVTQNQGSNFDPAWSPDGRLLVYASSRGGLWVANPDTRHEVQILRGGATAPSWGPPPRK